MVISPVIHEMVASFIGVNDYLSVLSILAMSLFHFLLEAVAFAKVFDFMDYGQKILLEFQGVGCR